MNYPGDLIRGRYLLIEKIGEGANGVVFLAEDMILGCTWAVKTVYKESSCYDDFIKEMRTISVFSHPSIPRVTDFFEDADNCYVVMDYVQGMTLEDSVKYRSAFDEAFAYDVILQLCNVLNHIHALGYLYLDLKPQNIIVGNDNRIFLVDFGSVRKKEDGTGNLYGTKGYAAPELLDGKNINERADIFALGKVIEFVFGGMCDRFVRNIIKRCCREKASRRFDSASQVNDFIRERLVERKKKRILKSLCILCFVISAVSFSLGLILQNNYKRKAEATKEECISLGYEFLENGDYKKAIDSFKSATKIDPYDARSYEGILNAYISDDKAETCIKEFAEEYIPNAGGKPELQAELMAKIIPVCLSESGYESLVSGYLKAIYNMKDKLTGMENELVERYEIVLELKNLLETKPDLELAVNVYKWIEEHDEDLNFAGYGFFFVEALYAARNNCDWARKLALDFSTVVIKVKNRDSFLSMKAYHLKGIFNRCGSMAYELALMETDEFARRRYLERSRELLDYAEECMKPSDREVYMNKIQTLETLLHEDLSEEEREEIVEALQDIYTSYFYEFSTADNGLTAAEFCINVSGDINQAEFFLDEVEDFHGLTVENVERMKAVREKIGR